MKALTTATMVLVLGLVPVDVAHARPKAPGSSTNDAIEGWCNEQGGAFHDEVVEGCVTCFFAKSDGTSEGYTCCTVGTFRSCSWATCDADSNCTSASRGDRITNAELFALRAFGAAKSKTPAQPDLVTLPTPASTGPQGFCRRNAQGQLLVKVRNQGGSDAPATTTRVVFNNAVPADVSTPAVTAGGSTELTINIPNACFDASNNCSFTLGADAADAAAESNETNNNAAGLCGPQFF